MNTVTLLCLIVIALFVLIWSVWYFYEFVQLRKNELPVTEPEKIKDKRSRCMMCHKRRVCQNGICSDCTFKTAQQEKPAEVQTEEPKLEEVQR
jgi:hypothetical protein